MQYQIVLPPEIRVSAEAFADAWNADEQSSVVAAARVEYPVAKSYDVDLFNTIMIGVFANLATSALYDLVKHVLTRMLDQPAATQRIEVQQIDQPDGTHLLVVHIKK